MKSIAWVMRWRSRMREQVARIKSLEDQVATLDGRHARDQGRITALRGRLSATSEALESSLHDNATLRGRYGHQDDES